MEPQRDFAISGLLHDLNNVLQTLVDAADRLSEDPRWQPLSAAILRGVERGRRIASSLEAGSQTGSQARVPFTAILDNAIAFVQDASFLGRGPAIEFLHAVEPEIELPGNWAWERVLINLFLNSMRAMPAGGTIDVRARRLPGAGGIEIVVRDSGTGIPPGILDSLFDPRVSTKATGGIGLHVVETIVRQGGGSVRAANRIDAPGAEFTITVPPVHLQVHQARA